MNQEIIKTISEELNVRVHQIEAVLSLLEEGNTVPFIARYRKEKTGALDEDQIRTIDKYYQYQVNLLKRKEDVIRLIDEKGMLNEKLKTDILKATQLSEVEDLYRPYKEKRKTKATAAKAKGLEPLAKWILALNKGDILVEAKKYLNDDVLNVEDAIQGALDIIAEDIADDIKYRKFLKDMLYKGGILKTSEKKKHDDENKVYEMYYNYQEKVKTLVSHRILAINRAEKEKVINVNIEGDKDYYLQYITRGVTKNRETNLLPYIQKAVEDSYQRLLFPSIERELRGELTEKAEAQAIHVFAVNLRQLLLQRPIGGHTVLGLDPGYRTGCKAAVIDPQGKVLATDALFITGSQHQQEIAEQHFLNLVKTFGVTLVSIGNGTASYETEEFTAKMIEKHRLPIAYIITSEAGASVYSASPLAREELPDLDVSLRGAVSIARRIQDPLAELVKIEPKAIGVGQYQHDVNQKELNSALKTVIESCVNHVGVDLNTASPALLSFISGISSTVAKNIIAYRNEHGRFRSRKELLKVPRLGPAAFTQCAGFLRITQGDNPLDNTPVHPESYSLTEKILSLLGCKKESADSLAVQAAAAKAQPRSIAEQLQSGIPTVTDILQALARPGRDPREDSPAPMSRKNITKLSDLPVGTIVKGTVRNVVDFGCFVDIGVKVDGLIHRSELSDKRFKHPLDIIAPGDIVEAMIISIDEARNRIGLSLKKAVPGKR